MGKTTRVFQPFEINNLGAMVSVMTELTTKGTREDGFNIISPLAFVIITPLGVLVPLVLVAPSWLVLWGLIPTLTWVVVIPVPSFLLGIVRWMSWVGMYSTVQNFGIVEQQRVEQNLPPHEDVGEPWVVEDQEMGSMDFVVVPIHKVHRKA
jgi:hypothetical protein